VEHFEDDDDNDNYSDDVEDISIHGSWITRRCPGRQVILMIATSQQASFVSAITVRYIVKSFFNGFSFPICAAVVVTSWSLCNRFSCA
jgi:hypothetical protein